jgi:hypothetical protein
VGGTGGSPNTADTTPSVTGPATTNASGVLTTLGGAAFTKTGGSLVITSLYAKIENLTSFNSIQLWGDMENRGTSLECIPLVTFAIDGYDILTIAEGPPYKGSSTVTEVCIPPGGKGIYNGIDNSVASTLLDHPTSVTYTFQTLVATNEVPHPATPSLVGATVDHGTGLYEVSGSLQARATDIHNLGIHFFVRDSSGLLRERLTAFPGDLGTIAAGSQIPFASSGLATAFSRFVAYSSFIDGPATSALTFRAPAPESLVASRSRLVDERFAAVAAEQSRP